MAKKTRIEDIDSEAVINSFRLDDTSIPPEARSTDGNTTSPPPKEAIQEAVSPHASHSKEEPERRRRNSKPEKLDYDTVFICGSNITARLGKQVYIRKEYHDRIQKMLHVIGGNEVTIAAFLEADKQEIIDLIKSTARFGLTYAQNKYNAIIQAATDANQFGYIIESNIKRIRLYISFIRKYDEEINDILESLHKLVDSNEDTKFVKQVHLIETFKGAGFLSAATIMGEIGDFSAFSKPKQLFAYFGLDPAVKQSGKFEGTKVQMSKRGSSIARRVIHTLSLQSISISRNGKAKNPVLREYYLQKCDSKPKLVAMGAVSHKVCNMIFAILRDNKPFEIITPQEHIKQYNAAKCDIAA